MESVASKFLKKLREDEEKPGEPEGEPAAPQGNPEDGEPKGEPEQKPELPDALKQLNQDMEQNPEMAGKALDVVGDMVERYMNDQDPSWTPGDDDGKAACQEARHTIRKAAQMLHGLKK